MLLKKVKKKYLYTEKKCVQTKLEVLDISTFVGTLDCGMEYGQICSQTLMRATKSRGGLTRGRSMGDSQRTLWILSDPVWCEVIFYWAITLYSNVLAVQMKYPMLENLQIWRIFLHYINLWKIPIHLI